MPGEQRPGDEKDQQHRADPAPPQGTHRRGGHQHGAADPRQGIDEQMPVQLQAPRIRHHRDDQGDEQRRGHPEPLTEHRGEREPATAEPMLHRHRHTEQHDARHHIVRPPRREQTGRPQRPPPAVPDRAHPRRHLRGPLRRWARPPRTVTTARTQSSPVAPTLTGAPDTAPPIRDRTIRDLTRGVRAGGRATATPFPAPRTIQRNCARRAAR